MNLIFDDFWVQDCVAIVIELGIEFNLGEKLILLIKLGLELVIGFNFVNYLMCIYFLVFFIFFNSTSTSLIQSACHFRRGSAPKKFKDEDHLQ